MTAAQRRNYGLSKMATKKKTASWSDLKAHLVGMEKDQLLALVKDLYGASKETQQFLHARYAVGGSDVLEPYKATITQWINPGDVRKPLSVSKAKKAITDYKKAVGDPQGLAELGVFYCEQVFASLDLCTSEDESFYDSLCVMFAQALVHIQKLPQSDRSPYIERMWQVRLKGNEIGWGVWDDFEQAWKTAGLPEMG